MTNIFAWRVASIALAGLVLALQVGTALEFLESASLASKASIVLVLCVLAVMPRFIEIAWRSNVKSLAAVLVVAFAAWFLYSIPSTIGRTGEVKEAKVAQAANQSEGRKLVMAEWNRAKSRLELATAEVAKFCAKSQVSDNCVKAKDTEADRQSRYDALLNEVVTAPAKVSGDVGTEMLAWMLSAIGVQAEHLRKLSVLSYAIGLDIIIWALVWFGTSDRIAGRPTVQPKKEAQEAITERADPITDEEIEELRKLLLTRKRPMTNQAIADHLGVSKGESSKRVTRAVEQGIVTRERIGREVGISLN